MTMLQWEQHTLIAEDALKKNDFMNSILHYQQALAISDELQQSQALSLDDKLTVSIYSCHNMAKLWRSIGDQEFELKYLQLASEKVLMLVPQCQNRECDSFIDSLGCCKKALIEYMKRHPNPAIASVVQNIETASNCNLIKRFKLN
ncbi:DUF2753 domain-containing protein [Vibrio sp.]|uniref:DUF2753 family protein n=1 Tax=Vibrio viridaestus TaxID=2487322 RepID=A0A3N9U513_9VIBR|nr:DUF2753 family protein [Vibrio viridaestus]MDC0612330.1 DUF2753 domain-containing protein [Vibrio sp.]RQW63126.1 DUF2753 family protein [Vibrio viridaestus]